MRETCDGRSKIYGNVEVDKIYDKRGGSFTVREGDMGWDEREETRTHEPSGNLLCASKCPSVCVYMIHEWGWGDITVGNGVEKKKERGASGAGCTKR